MPDAQQSPPPAWSDREAILGFLRDRDVVCPVCRYNLRGLSEPRCPECGHELRLRIGVADFSMGPWITAFAACTPGAGITFVLLLFTLDSGPPGPGTQGVLFFIGYWWCIATLFMAIALLCLRRRFVRLRRGTQVLFAGASVLQAAALMTLITAALFG